MNAENEEDLLFYLGCRDSQSKLFLNVSCFVTSSVTMTTMSLTDSPFFILYNGLNDIVADRRINLLNFFLYFSDFFPKEPFLNSPE